jgi:hypothetical protein
VYRNKETNDRERESLTDNMITVCEQFHEVGGKSTKYLIPIPYTYISHIEKTKTLLPANTICLYRDGIAQSV